MAMSLGHPYSNFPIIEVGDLTIPWVQDIKFFSFHNDTMLNWQPSLYLLDSKI